MATRSVVWFRRDLRLEDHPALTEALATGPVLALFVDDPAFDRSGGRRQASIRRAVSALRHATGGALVVRSGDPISVVPSAAAEIDAATVYVSKDYTPYGRRRDAAVASVLREAGRTMRGIGSPYAVPPGTVNKPDGSPYAVFTPFARRWRSVGWSPPLPAPTSPDWITAPSETSSGFADVTVDDLDGPTWRRRWESFASNALDAYDDVRDLPAVDGTSRLSVQLKTGAVHPRQLLAELDTTQRSHAVFADELAWREFYADVLFQRPQAAWHNLDRRFDRMHVDSGPAAVARFEFWKAGRTGYPIVDAGMRQLMQTGWMHNRLRMITASFLVKDLHLPWQWGARHFLDQLVDGDLASNNLGWQWVAGTGTDAAPYFRVFNPTSQQHKFDPDGRFVGRWVPELGTSQYPAPIVDHAAERAEALARYAVVKGG